MKEQYENRSRIQLARRSYTFIRLSVLPYQSNKLHNLAGTALYLAQKIPTVQAGYVHSNEVSLLLCDFWTPDSTQWFDGDVQSVSSVSASLATRYLSAELEDFYVKAKCFTMSDAVEAYNYFVWRQKLGLKRKLQEIALTQFSHDEIQGRNSNRIKEMLRKKGLEWNQLPASCTHGSIIMKVKNFVEVPAPDFVKDREFVTMLLPRLPKPDNL